MIIYVFRPESCFVGQLNYPRQMYAGRIQSRREHPHSHQTADIRSSAGPTVLIRRISTRPADPGHLSHLCYDTLQHIEFYQLERPTLGISYQ